MYRRFFKRLFDVLFAVFAFPFFIFLVIVAAPVIYLQDRGSVFYNAPRLGRNGKIFKMYKLRTMKMNAPDIRNSDGSTFNSEDDVRLTTSGKFFRNTSLDELPQVINILKGDMSLIGPRPDQPEAIDMYAGEENLKLSVRPGITGYSQAFFRNSVSQKEKFRNDVFYVKNLTLGMDMRIFFMTILSVFKRKNINIKVK